MTRAWSTPPEYDFDHPSTLVEIAASKTPAVGDKYSIMVNVSYSGSGSMPNEAEYTPTLEAIADALLGLGFTGLTISQITAASRGLQEV